MQINYRINSHIFFIIFSFFNFLFFFYDVLLPLLIDLRCCFFCKYNFEIAFFKCKIQLSKDALLSAIKDISSLVSSLIILKTRLNVVYANVVEDERINILQNALFSFKSFSFL